MTDTNMTMATLSPVIARIWSIASAIEASGGPKFNIRRNPDGIIELLNFASSSKDLKVRERYVDLANSDNSAPIECLQTLGHNFASSPSNSGSEYYRGAKREAAQANSANASQNTGSEAQEKKTKMVKVVYRGKVSYKEVTVD